MDTKTSFGAAVRAARRASGKTQVELAAAVGRAQSRISLIEHDYVGATAKESALIGQFLQMSPLRMPRSEPQLKTDHAAC